NKNIAIIEIGDDTINAIGKWPLPRKFHAELINALDEAGAKAIVFDIFFSEESDYESDVHLEEAIKKSGKVYLPYVFNIKQSGKWQVPVADKLQEEIVDKFKRFAKGTGFINIIPDTDGKFRRVPPLISYSGKLYPHVCFLLCADYFDLKMEEMKIVPGECVKLGGKLDIPLDSSSNIIVNFPGKWTDTFRHYSYIDILNSYVTAKLPAESGRKPLVDLGSFKGSVCFIGVTATATPDAHPSPFDPLYPGVGVHASLFNSFLINKFIKRAGHFINIAVLIILSAITLYISRRAKTFLGFILIFLFMSCYALLATLAFFVFGYWLDVFYPTMVVFFIYLGATFAKYVGETHKIEILENELGIAKKIQESFLPKEKPKAKGIDIAARMKTARQVGGDLYDFIDIGNGRIGVMIGDVSGKGVPAALYMAKVVSIFKTYAAEELASETITKLNEQLCRESGSGLFVTLSYLIFDTKTGFLSYSSGGHLPMIVVSSAHGADNTPNIKLIDLKEGTPLGLFEGAFSEEKIQFRKGDIFILYTDGVTEAMNRKGEMFSQERLLNIVRKGSNLDVEGIVSAIHREVEIFEGKKQHDDITVMAVGIS
ncbi:MAG: CHASE2 domain-containing protein, partial [Candidatus Omnitrophica bacterium]|nr:CHASE2 domain-containing protein [Candidatus Omnitrophota bacterium]